MNSLESVSDGISESNGLSHEAEALPKPTSNRFRNYVALISAFAVHLMVSTLFYTYYEGWSPSLALFFVIDTTSSVGTNNCFIYSVLSARLTFLYSCDRVWLSVAFRRLFKVV